MNPQEWRDRYPRVNPSHVTQSQVELAESIAFEDPPWVFAGGGRESPLHYIARLAFLSGMLSDDDRPNPLGRAHASLVAGKYSCGVPDCVDCTRTPSNRA